MGWLPPAQSLRAYVRGYAYLHEVAPSAYPVLPHPDVRIAFHLGNPYRVFDHRDGATQQLHPSAIVGPQTRHHVDLLPNERPSAFYVWFQPSGFQRLFGTGVPALVDQAYSAADVLGNGLRDVHEAIAGHTTTAGMTTVMDAFLLTRVRETRIDDAIDWAVEQLTTRRGGSDLDVLASSAGLSARQFRRRFASRYGIGPKQYAGLVRFSFAIELKQRRPSLTWTTIAHESGYFDQAHLVKDFRRLGTAPASRIMDALDPLRLV
jgi:AraC-like DNA-binding protein